MQVRVASATQPERAFGMPERRGPGIPGIIDELLS